MEPYYFESTVESDSVLINDDAHGAHMTAINIPPYHFLYPCIYCLPYTTSKTYKCQLQFGMSFRICIGNAK